jgi:hypothetical protein
MARSLSCPRSSFNRQLQLETLEDRWSLGGAGYLGASFGLGGAVSTLFDTDETFSGTSTAVRNIIGGNTGDATALTGSNSTGSLAEDKYLDTVFTGASTPILKSADNSPLVGFTTSAPITSESAISGKQDDGSILDKSFNDVAGRGNLFGAGAAGASAIANAGAGVSRRAVYSDTNAAASNSSNSAAIAGGGNAANLVGDNNGGVRSAPGMNSTLAADSDRTNVALITAQNRNAPTMYGGWNPALRSIMVMDDGSRWFAAELGTNVEVNSAIAYYRLGPNGWKMAGSVMLPAGIQQNMATITNGRVIYSYGCTRGSVIEAWFDTAHPRWNLISGNALTASGHVVNPGAGSNYIGAAWHNKNRIVWWTTGGKSGSGGNWTYSYNGGSGWNGPIVSGLGGYTTVGYIRAQFDDRNRIRMIGESYLGQFPNGVEVLSTTTVKLGNSCKWTPARRDVGRSPLDLWQEDSSNATEYLYATPPHKVGYSSDARFAGNSATFAALQARFIVSRDQFALVLAFKNSVEVRIIPRSEAKGYIDWNAIKPINFDLPKSLKSTGSCAIWNVDESKQPHESNQLEFAICGSYPAHDNLIFYYTISQF